MVTRYTFQVCCLLLWLNVKFPPAASAGPSTGRPQAEKSITFEVHAPPAQVLPLFGPMRESDWAPTWKPEFVYPAAGSNTQEGTVFTTGGGEHGKSVWILVEYSEERNTVRYAVVSPEESTTEIRVQLAPVPGGRTKVVVTERRTSLQPSADASITHFEQHFPDQAGHWQEAIEGYLLHRPHR